MGNPTGHATRTVQASVAKCARGGGAMRTLQKMQLSSPWVATSPADSSPDAIARTPCDVERRSRRAAAGNAIAGVAERVRAAAEPSSVRANQREARPPPDAEAATAPPPDAEAAPAALAASPVPEASSRPAEPAVAASARSVNAERAVDAVNAGSTVNAVNAIRAAEVVNSSSISSDVMRMRDLPDAVQLRILSLLASPPPSLPAAPWRPQQQQQQHAGPVSLLTSSGSNCASVSVSGAVGGESSGEHVSAGGGVHAEERGEEPEEGEEGEEQRRVRAAVAEMMTRGYAVLDGFMGMAECMQAPSLPCAPTHLPSSPTHRRWQQGRKQSSCDQHGSCDPHLIPTCTVPSLCFHCPPLPSFPSHAQAVAARAEAEQLRSAQCMRPARIGGGQGGAAAAALALALGTGTGAGAGLEEEMSLVGGPQVDESVRGDVLVWLTSLPRERFSPDTHPHLHRIVSRVAALRSLLHSPRAHAAADPTAANAADGGAGDGDGAAVTGDGDGAAAAGNGGAGAGSVRRRQVGCKGLAGSGAGSGGAAAGSGGAANRIVAPTSASPPVPSCPLDLSGKFSCQLACYPVSSLRAPHTPPHTHPTHPRRTPHTPYTFLLFLLLPSQCTLIHQQFRTHSFTPTSLFLLSPAQANGTCDARQTGHTDWSRSSPRRCRVTSESTCNESQISPQISPPSPFLPLPLPPLRATALAMHGTDRFLSSPTALYYLNGFPSYPPCAVPPLLQGNGARYARHTDRSPSSPHRRVTALYYLNPAWDPASMGGNLRLYLPRASHVGDSGAVGAAAEATDEAAAAAAVRTGMGHAYRAGGGGGGGGDSNGKHRKGGEEVEEKEEGEEGEEGEEKDQECSVDIAPLADRLLLFLSHIPHEVLPSHTHRFSLTFWFCCSPHAQQATSEAPLSGVCSTDGPHSHGHEERTLQGGGMQEGGSGGLGGFEMSQQHSHGHEERTLQGGRVQRGGREGLGGVMEGRGLLPTDGGGASDCARGGGGEQRAGEGRTGESSRERIFVSIASYRDSECVWTVRSLLENAAVWQRVTVGIVWQVGGRASSAHG
ncbi:unnamed protein product [Closterium sp. NIES-53]